MTKLYEILKTSKLGAGAAPDMFAALLAKKLAAEKVEKTISGIPPLTFRSSGKPLTSWQIDGNTVQSGTPTPDNPVDVNGVGERTGNLFDISLLEQGGWIAAAGAVPTKITPDTTGYTTRTRYNQIIPLIAVTLSLYCPANIKINYVWIDANGISLGGSGWQKNGDTATAPEQAVSMTFILGLDGDIECTPSDFYDINLVAGSTAPESYEPYGYKIPISSAGQTTPVYLGEVQTTRKIKKLVLNGTEDWALSSTPNAFYILTALANTFQQAPVCSHFKGSTTVTDNNIIVISETQRINIRTTSIPHNLTDWKNYLQQQYAAGTPVTVWYVLDESETGTVNEPLMKIGDYVDMVSKEQAGVDISTNNGSTTVDVDTTVKPSEVYIKYHTR